VHLGRTDDADLRLKLTPDPPRREFARCALLLAVGQLVPTRVWAAAAATGDGASAILVGPTRAIRTIAAASRVARDGSVIEIDAGDYVGDVAVWTQDRLTIRGRGTVRLVANGQSAEGKAIWVLRGGEVTIENITFTGARVADGNGAGIRLETGRVTVRGCRFIDNENGILTSNREDVELSVENSELGSNGAGDGQSHNLYAGAIARLSVSGSYFHHAKVGHLLKSRARQSDIRYNRLSDEAGGRASYELEFPNGGLVMVVGNLLQQSATTENPHMLSYGAEGYRWPRNSLAVVHNTFLDERSPPGVFFRVSPGNVESAFIGNLFVGGGPLNYPPGARRFGDVRGERGDLIDPGRGDFRLRDSEKNRALASPLPPGLGAALVPTREYAHPAATRELGRLPVLPGALQ
jgi:hypothetical protein